MTGAIIAYMSYPLYKKLSKHIRNKSAASFVIALLIVFIITVPFIIIVGLISEEAYYTYTTLNQHNLGTNFLRVACTDETSFTCKNVRLLVDFLPEKDLDYYLQITIKKITAYIIENLSAIIVSIPSFLLDFFVMIFIVYYLLKDGELASDKIKSILPLKESHKEQVIQRFHEITSAMFYGNLFIAVLQGILGGIGFLLFGVPSPILWGFVMIFFALLPYFGTALVWLPAALNLIFIGYLHNSNSYIINGVMLLVYGTLVVSTIDNFVKPKMLGAKADVHPVLVLLGVLGGLSLFGFIGLILGPLMLSLLITFIDIYEKEKAEFKQYF